MHKFKFSLGELVKAIRINAGHSQVEFCKALHDYAQSNNLKSTIVQSTISKIENDTFEEISFGTIDLISRMCQIPLRDFQLGYLTTKKVKSNNLVNSRYCQLPQFSSKFILELFSNMLENGDIDEKGFYKSLKFSKEALCFIHAKFDVALVQKAYQLYPDTFIKALKHLAALELNELSSAINTEQLSKEYPGFHFKNLEDTDSSTLKVTVDRKKTKRLKLNEADLLKCLSYDFKFGPGLKFKTSIISHNDNVFMELTV